MTSTQRNIYARSQNERLRYGFEPWRLMYYMLALFRQVRNSDDSGALFPPLAEFFQVYQNLKPTDGTWPVTGPGDGEGANVASMMNAFVFGSAAADIDSEADRISNDAIGGVPLWLGLSGVPTTPADIWELGKLQRGAYDPTTGARGSPSFTAAREHFKLSPPVTSGHGTSYGGYMPAPVLLGICAGDPNQRPNYQIFFTNLDDGSTVTFPGTCPDEPTHIAFIATSPFDWLVVLNDGSAQIFLRSEWIIGPFTGGAWIYKQDGQHVPRVLNWFASEFGGTPDQRETMLRERNGKSWLANAFDTHRFLSSQYFLAPAIGAGGDGVITAAYPLFRFTGSVAPGTFATHIQSGTNAHTIAEGFVLGACFISATKLSGATTLELYSDTELLETIEVLPDVSGNVGFITTFDDAKRAQPLKIKCSGATIGAGGKLEIECAELLDYKPGSHDLYLTLRLASCRVDLSNGLDGSGRDETSANVISDSYFDNGCILNINGAPGPAGTFSEVNSNAVFDAARRMSQFVRILPRHNFIGYEVTGGKSICYFRRYAQFPGFPDIDLFEGIAPNKEAITTGNLINGRVYTVRSGTITYLDVNYSAGTLFTATSQREFQGSGVVYEYDGIRHTAEPQGESNEWVMGQQFKAYHPSESSIWKPDAYSDYWALSERCQFYAPSYDDDLRWQFNYGSVLGIAPEAPTSWRYVKGSNHFLCDDLDADCKARRLARYKSCRIYEPDPEIESAIILIEDGQEVVKLTFTGRFHSHEDAPSSIARDVSGWEDIATTEATYRTVENGLREYLVWANEGKHCSRGGPANVGQQGNDAYSSTLQSQPDNPFGTCFPHFYFVKLLPLAYEDGNDKQNNHDTPLFHDFWKQAELYLRALCEGYVDGLTSQELGCEVGTVALFDYTFESLCFEAFGGQWLTTLPSESTRYIDASDCRDDTPQGFGPIPNTLVSSEIYNQYAAALNLLTRVRVMLPVNFETRTATGSDTADVSATWSNPPGETCNLGPIQAYHVGTPPNPSVGAFGAWFDATTLSSSVSASIDSGACNGASFILGTNREDAEWRYQFVDADAQYAIPEAWRDMVDSHGQLLAIREETSFIVGVERVTDIDDSSPCCFAFQEPCPGHWFDDPKYLKFNTIERINTTACMLLPSGGSLSAPAIGQSTFSIGRTASGANCFGIAINSQFITPILGNDVKFVAFPLVDAT